MRKGGGGCVFVFAVRAGGGGGWRGACFFLLFGRVRVFFAAVWAVAWPPPKHQKIQHAPAQTAKNETPMKPKQQKRPDNKNISTLTHS